MRQQDAERIAREYKTGKPATALARELGVSPDTVYRAIRSRGLSPGHRGRPRRVLTPSQREAIRSAYLSGETVAALQSRYSIRHETISETLGSLPEDLKNKSRYQLHNPRACEREQTGLSWEAAVERFRGFINQSGKSDVVPPQRAPREKERKILVLSDPHIPYHNESKLSRAAELHRDADLLILPGDFVDAYALSTFPKLTTGPSFREECQAGKVILEQLASQFPEVVIFPGNHEERALKQIARRLDNDLRGVVRVFDLIELLKVDCPNVTSPCYEIDGNEIRHIWNSGDLIIGHPETSGGGQGTLQGITKWIIWLLNWRRSLGFGDISIAAQGHTHNAGHGYFDQGVLGMELGCLCRIPAYAVTAAARYRRPPVNGYAVFYQSLVDGAWQTDRNESRFFEL